MKTKELKVLLSGEDWTFTKKYLVYEQITVDREDPKVKECILDAYDCLKITPDSESIRCMMVNK